MLLSTVCRVPDLVKWWGPCCACLRLARKIAQDKMRVASKDRQTTYARRNVIWQKFDVIAIPKFWILGRRVRTIISSRTNLRNALAMRP
jgi:hypothetical protein